MGPYIESEQDHERNAVVAGVPEGAQHETRHLRREVEELRGALRTRPMTDVALGMVMTTEGCSPDRARQVPVSSSQRTDTGLRTLAQRLTEGSASSLPPGNDTTAPDPVILRDAPYGLNPQKR
ncbi:ANTAR domain-containing protein [Streptomyces cyaneofuscatus]|uniref:ANTAR domain-containing protein n=1 Tax=Streptomyces cyaneofuscatus TaxID=66883 RepID=UPI00341E7445